MEESEADANEQQRAGRVADDREDADAPSGAVGEQDGEFDADDGNTDGSAGPVDAVGGPPSGGALRIKRNENQSAGECGQVVDSEREQRIDLRRDRFLRDVVGGGGGDDHQDNGKVEDHAVPCSVSYRDEDK